MKKVCTLVLLFAFTFSTVACTVDEVLSSIDVALQTAQSLSTAIGALNPADAAALTLLTGVGITGVEAIQKAYDNYEKNKTASNAQNVIVAAQSIQSNLPQELSALHISDPKAVTKATAWVNLMTQCATAIVGEVNALQNPTGRQAAYTLTPEYIQSQWQLQVCGNDLRCGALVKVHHKHHLFKF